MYKKICLALVVMLGLVGATVTASRPVHAEALHYAIAAQLPSNQINSSLSYFNLKVTPGQQQTLNVLLSNSDTKAHQYSVAAVRATTNTNGGIDYTKRGVKPASSLKADFEQMTPKKFTVSVPANTKQTVPVQLKVPTTAFTGVVLGGIRVQELDASSTQSKSKGIKLNNKFAYVLGVTLQEVDDYSNIKPEMILHRAGAKQINYRNYITATLENTQPTVMHKLKISAKVRKAGSQDTYLSTTQSQMTMAPNSNFDFPISTKNHPLEAGDYTLDLTASANDGDVHWHFTKNFTITRTQTNKLNKSAVDLQKPASSDNTLLYIFLAVGIVILIIVIILFVVILKPKKHKHPKK